MGNRAKGFQWIGLSQDSEYFVQHVGFVTRAQAGEHQHELIAPQSGCGVGVADMAGQALGDFFKHQIAGFVTIGVVDGFETIQINQCHACALAGASGQGNGSAQPVGQQGAVGQAGEHVVAGQAFEFFLLGLDLRNIGKDADIVHDLATGIVYRGQAQMFVKWLAIGAAVDDLAAPVAVTEQGVAHGLADGLVSAAFLMQQVGWLAHHRRTRIAGDVMVGTVDFQNTAVGIGNHDAFLCIAEHTGQQAQARFGGFAFVDVQQGADQPHGARLAVALDHLATAEQPYPVTIMMTDAELALEHRGVAFQVFDGGVTHMVAVLRVNPGLPVFYIRVKLAMGFSQHGGAARVDGDFAGAKIGIPQAEFAAVQRQVQPLLTGEQRIQPVADGPRHGVEGATEPADFVVAFSHQS